MPDPCTASARTVRNKRPNFDRDTAGFVITTMLPPARRALSRTFEEHNSTGSTAKLLTYLLTYLLHGAESFLTSYLVLQLIKKVPAFYGTRKFITVLTSARHLSILSQLHPVPTTPSYFLKIHLNIILPSTSWSPQWSLF